MPVFAAGLVARRGPGEDHAVLEQHGEVSLRRRVVPHLHVHRRRQHQPAAPCEHQRREQVIGKAVRHLGEEVRACRRDQDQVAVAESSMCDMLSATRGSHMSGPYRLAREAPAS
jgi:hypothetical protein